MNNKNLRVVLTILFMSSLLLTACSTGSRDKSAAVYALAKENANPVDQQEPAQKDAQEKLSPEFWVEEQPRIDDQGAVVVEIVPINLNNPGRTLDFKVSLNTHSVDLSMDLASISTLTTDNGLSVQALGWDAPRGGHHLSGILSFPAAYDDKPLLSGVRQLTLTLVDLDVPERIFVWEK